MFHLFLQCEVGAISLVVVVAIVRHLARRPGD